MIKKFVRAHTTLTVLILISFFVFVGMSPTIYEWQLRWKTKPVRYFELVHNFPTDYNLYLSKIRQGKEGAWFAREKYTSEPHAPSLIQELYVIIGRISDWSHVQTPFVWFSYHVARVFFAFFLLWVIWIVSRWFLAAAPVGWQVLGFLLVATASTWPKFESVDGWPRFGGYMPWYTMVDSLQRTTFMPHVLLAQTLMVFIIWVFSSSVPRSGTTADTSGGFITRRHPGNWVFLGVIGLVLGIIFPPGLLFIYAVLGFTTLGEFIGTVVSVRRQASRKNASLKEALIAWFWEDVYGRVIFGLISAPSLLYFYLLLSIYPWKRLAEYDILHPVVNFAYSEYFLALGATLPFGLLGAATVIFDKVKTEMTRLRFFLMWIFSWLFLLFLFSQIPAQSPTRFTQMVPHVPLGLFSAYLFYRFAAVLKKMISSSPKKTSVNHESGIMNYGKENKSLFTFIHNSLFIIPVVIILLGCGTMASSYMWLKDFVDHKLRADIPLVPHGPEVMYPLKDIVEGLTWLQVYTPRDSVVLSGETTGNYIPVYAGNTAFVGHANTVNSEVKLAIVGNFYVRRLSVEEEMAWLAGSGVSYVFYGPEERGLSGGVDDLATLYPALAQVYQNASVRIYKAPLQ